METASYFLFFSLYSLYLCAFVPHANFNQKRWYPKRKIGKSEKIFTPLAITT
jgi:hypothetical protein